MELLEICKQAKNAKGSIGILDTNTKNSVLLKVADALIKDSAYILSENRKDLKNGRANGMSEGLLDRLMLKEDRIEQMSDGLRKIVALDDPIGEVLSMKIRPNGLKVGKKRVPLGVVGIIYEARPNVTADAFGLCFKTGNVVILKGGSDAIHSNIAIVNVIKRTLRDAKVPETAISLIESTDRETATAFMKMNEYVDVLIPRGGAGLIKTVVNQATIPVIETGTGNCHIFVDETADLDMAVKIIMNAKTQRIGVCNACESLVLHENIVDALIPQLLMQLQTKMVEVRCDEKIKTCADSQSDLNSELIKAATEEDWGREYLDYILSAKTVANIDEAIDYAGDLQPGASYTKYIYALYDGDGKYVIEFDNYREKKSVQLNIKK